MNNEIKIKLFKLIEKKQALNKFERWVYSTPELEDFFTPNDYLNFISINFSSPGAWYDVRKFILRIIDISDFETWRLTQLLESIISRDENHVESILRIYDLSDHGYYFLDELAIKYGLSLIVPSSIQGKDSFSQLTQLEVENIVSQFYPSIEQEAKSVLEWLEKKQIIPKGLDDDNYFRYENNRKQ